MTQDEKDYWFNYIIDDIKNNKELIEIIDTEFDNAYDPVNGKGLDGNRIGDFIRSVGASTTLTMIRNGFDINNEEHIVLKSKIDTELIEYVLYRNNRFILEECL